SPPSAMARSGRRCRARTRRRGSRTVAACSSSTDARATRSAREAAMKMQSVVARVIPGFAAAGIAWSAAVAPAAAQDAGAMTLILNRLNDLETQMLSLTNRVEQLDYQVRELSSRVELLARDVDFRFSELGGSGSSGSSGSSGGTVQPTPPVPQLETPRLDSSPLPQGAATGVTPPTIRSGTATTGAVAGTPEAEFQAIRAMLDNREYAASDAAL